MRFVKSSFVKSRFRCTLFLSIFLKLDDWRMKIGTVISTPFIFAERKTWRLTPPFLIEWSQIEETVYSIILSALSLSKLEIWWKGTSHSNQVVVLGLVVVLHTDHHVCTMVQKLGNLFWIMHPTTNLVGCVIQKRSFYSYITFA